MLLLLILPSLLLHLGSSGAPALDDVAVSNATVDVDDATLVFFLHLLLFLLHLLQQQLLMLMIL